MNRIVRENYPVADLPDDLRCGLGGDYVRVTLEQEPQHTSGPAAVKRTRLAQLYKLARQSFNGLDEIAAHIDHLRRERD